LRVYSSTYREALSRFVLKITVLAAECFLTLFKTFLDELFSVLAPLKLIWNSSSVWIYICIFLFRKRRRRRRSM